MTPEQAETIKDLAFTAIEEAYASARFGRVGKMFHAQKDLMDAIDALTTEEN